MRLVVKELHPASSKVSLNEEWLVVENPGDKPFSTAGCAVQVGRGKGRLRQIGTIDPGFTLAPGESIRIVTGNPSKKAQGKTPDDGVRTYHLFGASQLLDAPGATVALALKQYEVLRVTYDPEAPGGVRAGDPA